MALSEVYAQMYRFHRGIPAANHVRDQLENFRDTLYNERFDLSQLGRVYSDFYVKEENLDAFISSLEGEGFDIIFVGASSNPTFLHARREAIWTERELMDLPHKLLHLCELHDVAYESSFIVSVAEDEEA